MNIKQRLTILNFLEFFIWGTWLLSAGAYMTVTMKFTGLQVGAVYATMGIVSLFMPTLIGIIADKYLSAQKLFGICQFILAILFVFLTKAKDFNAFYIIMFFVSIVYMPTLALNNSISYYILEKNNYDTIKVFPAIRVWGTIGFIIAAWCIDFTNLKALAEQFYFGAVASIVLGFYAFTLPDVPPLKAKAITLVQRLGLDAFVLFKEKKMATFLFFSILLGAVLQITNIWGVPFLNDFARGYKDSFAVKHSVILVTLSQVSEVFFILAIPYFLEKFGIKRVVLISMFAWVIRFGLFALGNPEGIGLLFLILSMIVYGMAFDFFFISGSLFVDREAKPNIRSSAQGVFMMMTSGFGPIIGGYGSGLIVDYFTLNNIKNWPHIWFAFAIYALVIGLAFAALFRYRHQKGPINEINK